MSHPPRRVIVRQEAAEQFAAFVTVGDDRVGIKIASGPTAETVRKKATAFLRHFEDEA